MKQDRKQYPRPQFIRSDWLNLNGEWDFTFDDNNIGIIEKWYDKHDFIDTINIPFTYQCEKSGINLKEHHDIVWYKKIVKIPDNMIGSRLILNFGAVDYKADVWFNGEHLITHEGGHVPFSVEITTLVLKEENSIVVRAQDYMYDLELPRGKQYWKLKSESIFYTGTTGIWQTVWIEPVGNSYMTNIWLTPDIDEKTITLEYEVDTQKSMLMLNVEIKYKDVKLIIDTVSVMNGRGKRVFNLDHSISQVWHFNEEFTWSPEHPVLFDMNLQLRDETVLLDYVDTYFGMRKVSIVNGVFMLNNKPYYQKMLLDQGYWEESLLTAPDDEAFITDISLAKEMGFNGVRKHQKIEDPRYLYHADKMGFLVWGEIASAYVYSRTYVKRITVEWMDMIKRDYNHPSIVVWTPLNESWGIDGIMNNKNEQDHAVSMYYLTKSLDQTRPVISNDGWDHTKTDLLTIHDYEEDKDVLLNRYATIDSIVSSKPAGRGLFVPGWNYENQPIIVSEFGGISYQKGSWEGWGYSNAESDEDFIDRYEKVVSAMFESPLIQGFVYTQLTDVEQEINGLLTYDRKPKVDLAIIRQINERK